MDPVDDFPVTVRVGGREYDCHPDMSLSEFMEMTQTIQNEMDKLRPVLESMGVDVESLYDGGDG